MYYLTAVQSGQSGADYGTKAFVLPYLRTKDRLQIVLACVGKTDTLARLTDVWKNGIAKWCRNGSAQTVLERAERALWHAAEKTRGDLALLCCAGDVCFYAWRGDADIRLLNTSFGRSSVRTLTRVVEHMTREWAELEPQVGILLGGRAFFETAGTRDLTETLAIRSLCSQLQAERHLAEIAWEPAALIVTKDGLLLGSGAFGCVYRTGYEGRTAACKEARTADGIDLLRREAELLREIEHPLFPVYYGFTMENGTARLFMEEIRGRTLADYVGRGKQMPEREAWRLAAELADGLLYLHRLPEPVVYRDLKPENIILTRKAVRYHACLLDLGCACRISESAASRAGTPGYAAPEQLGSRPQSLTPACDVYALGAVLEYMAGDAAGEQMRELIAACMREDPRRRPTMEKFIKLIDNPAWRAYTGYG